MVFWSVESKCKMFWKRSNNVKLMVRHSCLGSILNHENDAVATINTNHFFVTFQNKIVLTFNYGKHTARFNVGAKLKVFIFNKKLIITYHKSVVSYKTVIRLQDWVCWIVIIGFFLTRDFPKYSTSNYFFWLLVLESVQV